MSGDALCNLDGLRGRVQKVVERRTRLVTLRDRLQEDLTAKEAEVAHLSREVEVLAKVCELLRVLMDQLVESQVRIVEKIGTEGVRTIFPDLDLSLESEVGVRHNKVAVDFYIRKGEASNPISYRGRPLESFGGGPCSVLSLILRVLAVKKLGLAPILVLDESLNAVSDEYIDATSQFMRALATKMGFDILLVTHKIAFSEHAHTAYRCVEELEESGSHLVLRRIQ